MKSSAIISLGLAVAVPVMAASQSGRDEGKHYKSLSAYESAMTSNPATPAPKLREPAVVTKKKSAPSDAGKQQPARHSTIKGAASVERK